MRWIDFISDHEESRQKVETEFTWMRRYAFKYFLDRTGDFSLSEDYSHCVIEQFIGRLKIKGELNIHYFKIMVRYFICNEFRRWNHDLLSHCDPVPASRTDFSIDFLLTDPCDESSSANPEDNIQYREFLQIFTNLMDELDIRDQKIVKLKLLGHSSREVCDIIGCSENQITVNLVDVITSNFRKRCRKAVALIDDRIGMPG